MSMTDEKWAKVGATIAFISAYVLLFWWAHYHPPAQAAWMLLGYMTGVAVASIQITTYPKRKGR